MCFLFLKNKSLIVFLALLTITSLNKSFMPYTPIPLQCQIPVHTLLHNTVNTDTIHTPKKPHIVLSHNSHNTYLQVLGIQSNELYYYYCKWKEKIVFKIFFSPITTTPELWNQLLINCILTPNHTIQYSFKFEFFI